MVDGTDGTKEPDIPYEYGLKSESSDKEAEQKPAEGAAAEGAALPQVGQPVAVPTDDPSAAQKHDAVVAHVDEPSAEPSNEPPPAPINEPAPVPEPVDPLTAPKSVIADWKEKSASTPDLTTIDDGLKAMDPTVPAIATTALPPAVEVERVPVETALSNAWDCTIKNILLLFAISTLFGLVYCAPYAVRLVISEIVNRNWFLNLCLGFVGLVIPIMYHMGRIKVTLQLHRKEPFSSDVFVSVGERIFHYILMLFCRTFLIISGYILFIVPGVIIQIRLDYADYFILDKKMNAFKAMKESWRVTENSALMLFLFNVICHFIELIGWVMLLVGSVPARWLTGIAKAEIYDRLCATAPQPVSQVIPPVASPNAQI